MAPLPIWQRAASLTSTERRREWGFNPKNQQPRLRPPPPVHGTCHGTCPHFAPLDDIVSSRFFFSMFFSNSALDSRELRKFNRSVSVKIERRKAAQGGPLLEYSLFPISENFAVGARRCGACSSRTLATRCPIWHPHAPLGPSLLSEIPPPQTNRRNRPTTRTRGVR